MNDRQYVIRACEVKGFDLLKPTKAAPGIVVYDYKSGFGRCIVEADTWAQARTQLDQAYKNNYA